MCEIRDFRDIGDLYEGPLEDRLHDFCARIEEADDGICDPDHFVGTVGWLLWEWAVQHSEHPAKLWHEQVAAIPVHHEWRFTPRLPDGLPGAGPRDRCLDSDEEPL